MGDLAGAPVVKLAMEQGWRVAHHIAKLNGRMQATRRFLTCWWLGPERPD